MINILRTTRLTHPPTHPIPASSPLPLHNQYTLNLRENRAEQSEWNGAERNETNGDARNDRRREKRSATRDEYYLCN